MSQQAANAGLAVQPLVAAVPAYLSDELDRRFTFVRADAACPFCGAAKNVGALACYTCYGAEVLRELGDDDLVVLAQRETALSAIQEQTYDELAPVVQPLRAAADRRALALISRTMLVIAAVLVLSLGLALWAVSGSSAQPAAARRAVPVGAFEPGGGAMSAPALAPEITAENRRTAALVFVKTVYDVDRETRAGDLATALAMMTPEAALQFAHGLRQSGMLAREQRAGVRAWWQREAVEIDPLDPALVRLRGRQMIDRAGGLPSTAVPMAITVTLVEDPLGRTPRNQMTGLLIASFAVALAPPD